jgi:N-hydroxyarylamine O-acetyltransferase
MSTPNVNESLSPGLLERVLGRLGFREAPELNPGGLRALYSAWCGNVPFDNVRKLIHVRNGSTGPLPGSTAEDFFEAWLRHGTGGTCWAGNGAFAALLQSLGFDAVRGVGTMLAAPDIPPNHGTVRVTFDGKHFLTDCSILHVEPLPLDESGTAKIEHPAWGIRTSVRDGRLHVWWRAFHKVDGFECRIEGFGADDAEFRRRHEETRGWSPFNYEVNARRNLADRVTGLAFGNALSLESDGSVCKRPATDAERRRVLIEEIGLSEEIVHQLPEDTPTPPPPGSRTALAREAAAA